MLRFDYHGPLEKACSDNMKQAAQKCICAQSSTNSIPFEIRLAKNKKKAVIILQICIFILNKDDSAMLQLCLVPHFTIAILFTWAEWKFSMCEKIN